LKIVIDTNIIISGLLWSGICSELMKKINTTKNEVIKFILETFLFVKIGKNISDYEIKDKDDIKFLQLSLENNVDFLISGDSHLLDIKDKYENILSINDFFSKFY